MAADFVLSAVHYLFDQNIKYLRNYIALSIDRIIMKSSPGAAVYPDQLPHVAAAAVLSLFVNCFNE